MEHLLTSYTTNEILLVLIITAIAVKQVISLIQFFKKRAKEKIEQEEKPETILNNLNQFVALSKQEINRLDEVIKLQVSRCETNEKRLNNMISLLTKQIDRLIASDKDSIKAWLTTQHHHFTEKGCIDYYSLDCIKKRYEHYKAQGGNSFIEDLMEEINSLPKIGNPIDDYHK